MMNVDNLVLSKAQVDNVFNNIKKKAPSEIKIEVVESPRTSAQRTGGATISQPTRFPPTFENENKHNAVPQQNAKVFTPPRQVPANIPQARQPNPEISGDHLPKSVQEDDVDDDDEEEDEGDIEEDEEEKDETYLDDDGDHDPDELHNENEDGKSAHRHTPDRNPRGSAASFDQPSEKAFSSHSYVPPEDYNSADVDVDAENRNPASRSEKRQILFLFRKKFPADSGDFNMQMPLYELKYEFQQREDHQNELEKIKFMKDMLVLLLHGIEGLNKKFGPFLELEDWSASITQDMSQFDRPLTGIYLQFFKKKRMSPIMELIWIIVTSMAIWHIRAKLGKKGNQTQQTRVFDAMHGSGMRPPSKDPKNFPAANPLNMQNLFKMFGGRN
jgi:hypothetical protein